MKAVVEIYKGIEYIQLSVLPEDQKNEILKSLSDRLVIRILRNDVLLKDCVQFQHYEYWYENIFSKLKIEEEQTVSEKVPTLILTTLAFNKSYS